ncbi:ATP-binding cassette domain-containing protein [Dactylosporangium sp. NPDC051485]|uniref:ABC transporter ATP-binding protein n=1 Tax=Dactylosporangium sp. NPDC051485 TaxID=3154846 RepID=UPI0034436CD9
MNALQQSEDPSLVIEDVVAGYNGVGVLRHVSLSVRPGQVIALLGPNGSGKTTLLQTIAGFVRPYQGSVRVGEADVTRVPSFRRAARFGISLVSDDRALIGPLTVHETLRLAWPWQAEPFDIFPELVPLARRRCDLLSGGEQQMLAIARALSTRPRFLLVDELSLGLAPILVSRILDTLRRFVASWNMGVLLVEQHVEQALAYADYAVVMAGGEVQLEGTATEVASSRDRLAATYFGMDR